MSLVKVKEEKRQHPRYEGSSGDYAAFSDFVDRENAQYRPVFVRNFSEGGVCLILDEKLTRHHHLIIRLYDPNDNQPIEVLGRIVWMKKAQNYPATKKHYDLGIEIVFVDDVNRQRLEELVRHHASLQDK